MWISRKAWSLAVAATVLSACLGLISLNHHAKWRATVIVDKAMGRLPDIGWWDLLSMLVPGSQVYLGQLAKTPNPFAVIANPHSSENDIQTGAQLFRKHCSSCHGSEGGGGIGGPSLRDRAFQHGGSDWALYRTITDGIAGTAMVSRNLSRDDTWRLVSYLRYIRKDHEGGAATGNESPPAQPPLVPVTAAELRDADNRPDEWLTYSGSYNSHRHSSLREINRDNVGQLRVAWLRQFPAADERVETSPIVRGSTMVITEPPSSVYALDAASGRILWSYSRDLPARLSLCCKPVNRGVAALDDRVFVGTLDAHLIALDAHTGTVMWDIAVADASKNYSITAAPLAVDSMVVTGVAGGEFGMRGFIDAYDAISGQRLWRFYTVPAPGEPGSETWRGDSWRTGGAPTWLTGSFDPDLGLIYWAVGNRFPNYENEGRGDELYSDSVVALEATTGKLCWYFQFTPGDTHDWDAVQIPVLVDATLGLSPRKLLAWANRNAFFYLLDRVTGKFLLGTPFARQTWADGLDASGRPRMRPESRPSREGSEVYPNQIGATNWWSPSYDPAFQLLYVPVIDRGAIFLESAEVVRMAPDEETMIAVKALDVTTGRVRWQYKRSPRLTLDEVGGLLSTAGGIVFGGDNEVFFALDAETGAELWRFNTGGLISAASVTYKVDGQQYVAIAAGRSILAFGLPR